MKQTTKQLTVLIALLAQAAITQAITVDFDPSLGPGNITGDYHYQDGVTVTYNAFGDGATAQVIPGGITGSTDGQLLFDFDQEVNALAFDLTLQGVTPPVDVLWLDLLFWQDNLLVESVLFSIPAGSTDGLGNALGHLAYSGANFNRAAAGFLNLEPITTFDLANFSYEVATAPPTGVPDLPSTFGLLTMGLIGLGGGRAWLRKA